MLKIFQKKPLLIHKNKGVGGINSENNNPIITIEIPYKDDVHIVPTKDTV